MCAIHTYLFSYLMIISEKRFFEKKVSILIAKRSVYAICLVNESGECSVYAI